MTAGIVCLGSYCTCAVATTHIPVPSTMDATPQATDGPAAEVEREAEGAPAEAAVSTPADATAVTASAPAEAAAARAPTAAAPTTAASAPTAHAPTTTASAPTARAPTMAARAPPTAASAPTTRPPWATDDGTLDPVSTGLMALADLMEQKNPGSAACLYALAMDKRKAASRSFLYFTDTADAGAGK